MKVHIVTNDGELLDTIEDIEEYDLSKSFAKADIIETIEQAVIQAIKEGKS